MAEPRRATPPPTHTSAARPLSPATKPAVAAIAAAANETLSAIAPEWKLVLRRRAGARKQAVDYPRGAMMKGGRYALLNEHAARLLAGVAPGVPPPQELLVRVFVDVKNRLVGFSRTDKEDSEAFALQRAKRRATPTWSVRVLEDLGAGAPAKRVHGRVQAFGNRVFGFSYGGVE